MNTQDLTNQLALDLGDTTAKLPAPKEASNLLGCQIVTLHQTRNWVVADHDHVEGSLQQGEQLRRDLVGLCVRLLSVPRREQRGQARDERPLRLALPGAPAGADLAVER